MTCPRCSQPLSTLSFDGRAARYCERCGFVGVETVHERDAPSRESWDDAIARFHERAVREAREREEAAGSTGGADSGESTDGDTTEDVADVGDDEADDEATDREPTDSQLRNGEDGDHAGGE
ncbi:zinc finger domain-containing protein [Haloferax marisrubri]|uniref:Zinc finger FPG/IleRS-type domain-containing protein n=1 Tax=Haloferax marisrubri TaxID=1544719 RepID=A0A2P4NQP3_9EURY|nr:zinc finger domain-containing protein [Haloferax marisrubri]POG55462.1 hypothetical protein AUR65_008585 [Haloferax marisrubri]